jgi:hypothetical protein
MRNEQADAKKGPKDGLLAVLMGLVLVVGFLLSLRAPTMVATSFVEVGDPEAAEVIASTPDGVSPGATIAQGNRLGLRH